MKELATTLLKEKHLKITSQRLSILDVMLSDSSKAYSLSTLLHTFKNEMNKSTIYRSLNALVEKQVVQKMISPNGENIYSLNLKDKCRNTSHPHLRCTSCGTMECLPSFPKKYEAVLSKSGVDNLNIVLGGTCSNCLKKIENDK